MEASRPADPTTSSCCCPSIVNGCGICAQKVRAVYNATTPLCWSVVDGVKGAFVETIHGVVSTAIVLTLAAIHLLVTLYNCVRALLQVIRTVLCFPVQRKTSLQDEAEYCEFAGRSLFNFANLLTGNTRTGIYEKKFVKRADAGEEDERITRVVVGGVGGVGGVLAEVTHGIALFGLGVVITTVHSFAALYYTATTVGRVIKSLCCFPTKREAWFQEEAAHFGEASRQLYQLENGFDGNFGGWEVSFRSFSGR